MELIYETLEIDLSQNRRLQTINVKQFEKEARQIDLYLFYNGQPFYLSGREQATINASVGGVVTTYDKQCYIMNSNTNKIEIPLYESLTTLPGVEHCEVKIVDSTDDVLYTATFNLNVEPSVATSESAAALQTTELASVLADHENRITALENNSGGVNTIGTVYGLMGGVTTSRIGTIEPYTPETE